MASISNQVDTILGYQDEGSSWATSGDLYCWNSAGSVNNIAATFDCSALASGETVTGAELRFTYGGDNDSGSQTFTVEVQNAANPTTYGSGYLPRSQSYYGTTASFVAPASPSGEQAVNVTSMLTAFIAAQGPENIGNMNFMISLADTGGNYISAAAASNAYLDITVTTGGGGTAVPVFTRHYMTMKK